MLAQLFALMTQVAQSSAGELSSTRFLSHDTCPSDPQVLYSPDLDPSLVRLTGYGTSGLASIVVVVKRDGRVVEASLERSSSDRKLDTLLMKWAKAHVYAADACGSQELFRLRIRVAPTRRG